MNLVYFITCNIDPQILLHRPRFLEKVAAKQRRRAQLRSNDESDSGCDNDDDDFDYTPFGYSFDPDYGDVFIISMMVMHLVNIFIIHAVVLRLIGTIV
jgi:hypothetical protein